MEKTFVFISRYISSEATEVQVVDGPATPLEFHLSPQSDHDPFLSFTTRRGSESELEGKMLSSLMFCSVL